MNGVWGSLRASGACAVQAPAAPHRIALVLMFTTLPSCTSHVQAVGAAEAARACTPGAAQGGALPVPQPRRHCQRRAAGAHAPHSLMVARPWHFLFVKLLWVKIWLAVRSLIKAPQCMQVTNEELLLESIRELLKKRGRGEQLMVFNVVSCHALHSFCSMQHLRSCPRGTLEISPAGAASTHPPYPTTLLACCSPVSPMCTTLLGSSFQMCRRF